MYFYFNPFSVQSRFTMYHYTSMHTHRGRIKRFLFYGAVQFDTCEAVHIFLIYLLMIFAYSNCSISIALIYAGNLDKHWNYPNFLNASYHYRNIVPHIHAYFCHKV